MKRIAIVLLFAVILSGCVGVNGEPIGQEIMDPVVAWGYENGYIDGCLNAIFHSTTPEDRPPFEVAVEFCQVVFLATIQEYGFPDYFESSAPIEAPVPKIDCSSGSCL